MTDQRAPGRPRTRATRSGAQTEITGESPREETPMKIIVRTSIDPETWGNECDARTAHTAAEKLADALAAYAVEAWPEDEVDANVQTYVGSPEPLVTLEGVEDPDGKLWEEVNAAVEFVMEDIWVGCLQAAIDAQEPA